MRFMARGWFIWGAGQASAGSLGLADERQISSVLRCSLIGSWQPFMTELANHVAGLPEGQEKLFPDRFTEEMGPGA